MLGVDEFGARGFVDAAKSHHHRRVDGLKSHCFVVGDDAIERRNRRRAAVRFSAVGERS
jgi:hypothetical protein